MLTSRRALRRDDGVAVVVVALSLVVLMVFTAFAIDLGQVYAERRVDQNTADAAATSGAIQLLRTQSAQGAVTEIIAKVDDDLGRSVASSDWTSCADPNPLARTASSLGLTPSTGCISFASDYSKVRVRLPDQIVKTSFGRVVGIDDFSSSAFAEASMLPAGGGALPFVVLSGAGNGDQICLRTDNSGGSEPPNIPPTVYTPEFTQDPCDKENFAASEGGRGTLIPALYDQSCGQPGNKSIVDAVMAGMDHMLGTYDPPVSLAPGGQSNSLDLLAQTIEDDTDCPTPFPNAVEVDTGFTPKLLYCALLDNPCNDGSPGVTTTKGRLHSAGSSATFNSVQIDDQPLWSFFVSELPPGAPASCNDAKNGSSSGAGFYERRAAMFDCLANWTSGQLFTPAIGNASRIGFVPKVAELGLCNVQPNPPPPDGGCSGAAPKHVHVNSFAPVYIDGVYFDNGAVCDTDNPATPTPGGTKWVIHYPGKTGGLDCSTGHDEVSRLSGVVIPCGALPIEVCDPSPSGPFPDLSGITRVRLSK